MESVLGLEGEVDRRRGDEKLCLSENSSPFRRLLYGIDSARSLLETGSKWILVSQTNNKV